MQEVRLIDANAAADKIMRETENRADDLNMIGIALMFRFARMLRDENDFPTIEAEPVRHGRWITIGQEIYCSECNEESLYNSFGASKFSRFCPNCGARMDATEQPEKE